MAGRLRRDGPCYAVDCGRPVKRTHLMCGRHWAMVPYPIRNRVWREYRRGFSTDWVAAINEARAAVAAREQAIKRHPASVR